MVGESALSAGEVAEMFFTHIVWQFGLPGEVVHDWDARFTADLWRNLWALLGTRVHLSSMHHPQSGWVNQKNAQNHQTGVAFTAHWHIVE